MESMIEAIKKCISVRTYINTPLEQNPKEIIQNLLKSNCIDPFGHQCRFELIDFSELDKNEMRNLGTYGFIKGANVFIVGAAKVEDKAMEDFGYCLESIIIEITKLGLGTCWIVSSFKRANFARKVHNKEDEAVIGISPVGYAHEKRSITDKFVRFTGGSHKRKNWNELFFYDGFDTPLHKELSDEYAIALEAVRLAPSGANIQPWRII